MTDTIGLLEAEGEAENVIKRYGFVALPICPFTIAKNADIIVQPKDSDEPGVSGFLMRVGSTFGILYARHIANEGFIRFTVEGARKYSLSRSRAARALSRSKPLTMARRKPPGGMAWRSGAQSSWKVICTLVTPGVRLISSTSAGGGWR